MTTQSDRITFYVYRQDRETKELHLVFTTKSETEALAKAEQLNLKHGEDYEYFVGCEEDKYYIAREDTE